MRRLLFVVLAAVAAGCAVGGDDSGASRVDRCVERLLSRAEQQQLTERRRAGVERYARDTYCERFERRGWINADGTLAIDAHRWAVRGMRCAVAGSDLPEREVDCEQLAAEEHDPVMDCALLHHVRRDEVRAYLRALERTRGVEPECDDGTPLDALGVE